MILIDDRVGSVDLADPLRALGLPDVQVTRMDSADVAFIGRGPRGRSQNIGIELKKLPDLAQSIRSGRLAGDQLPKMLGPQGAYDYAWLLVEGQWQVDSATGKIAVKRRGARFGSWAPLPGKMSVAEMEKSVLTLELCAGMHVRYCTDRTQTLHFIGNLFRWFTDKDFDQHASHITVHTPSTLVPLSEFRGVVSRFPHVGIRTSLAVETRFAGNLVNAVCASARDWAAIETVDRDGKGRRLGAKAGQDIHNFCRGL